MSDSCIPTKPVEEETTTASTITDMPMACDFNKLAPTSLPPNVEFIYSEEVQPDGSVEGFLVCRRTDDMHCDIVQMFATNPSGTTEILEFAADSAVGATIKCKDGVFSHSETSIIDGITRLSCVFDDCA